MFLGNGVDFVSSPKLVMIQPGQEEVNVTIDITNDNIAEGIESFCLLLHVPANTSEAGVVAGTISCTEAIILGEQNDDGQLTWLPWSVIFVVHNFDKLSSIHQILLDN